MVIWGAGQIFSLNVAVIVSVYPSPATYWLYVNWTLGPVVSYKTGLETNLSTTEGLSAESTADHAIL